MAAALGLLAGTLLPARSAALDGLIWPVLALLLFVTFCQVPMLRLRAGHGGRRYLWASVAGNFLLMPLLVALLLQLLPDIPALRLAVCLVLLAPCTDWFISFTHLARGNTQLAVVSSPLLLLGQLIALPVWLLILLGTPALEAFRPMDLLVAFFAVVLVPLLLALAVQHLLARLGKAPSESLLAPSNALLLALVLFLVCASHAAPLFGEPQWIMLHLLVVYLLYACAALVVGLLLARAFRLRYAPARTLVFSLGTRNSFVVLPLALVTHQPELAATAVALQALVELAALLVYLRLVPTLLPEVREPVQ
ncbi:MAG: arsenic resistance protein [Ectothiorhodospiraceae bacterium]|nr:arsenic resistance protein [Ectothiorhodospiraceae bacterium]